MLGRGQPGHARCTNSLRILKAQRLITDAHADAVRRLLSEANLSPSQIACVGFHGQTILHRPAEWRTWQIGDGQLLADSVGIPVVNEFRLADVKAGGQGAPFVPLYHQVLTRGMDLPVVVVNIGGVANVTYVGADGELIAFDTGPGNAALDDWALKHTGEAVDRDGKLAAAGHVDQGVLEFMLDHPIFRQPPPKSLDRFDFPMAAVEGLSGEDGAATLTAFTAAAIARAQEHLPDVPHCWIICGGGRHNPVLMARIACAPEAEGDHRGRSGMARRFSGSRSFRLSGGAQHQGIAPEPALNHRRAISNARRTPPPTGNRCPRISWANPLTLAVKKLI